MIPQSFAHREYWYSQRPESFGAVELKNFIIQSFPSILVSILGLAPPEDPPSLNSSSRSSGFVEFRMDEHS